MSFLVMVPTLAWVLRAAFRLRGHAPMADPMVCLGFRTLVLLPWQGLG
jgi:hypothetical protein